MSGIFVPTAPIGREIQSDGLSELFYSMNFSKETRLTRMSLSHWTVRYVLNALAYGTAEDSKPITTYSDQFCLRFSEHIERTLG